MVKIVMVQVTVPESELIDRISVNLIMFLIIVFDFIPVK